MPSCGTCGDYIDVRQMEGKEAPTRLGRECIQCRSESVVRNKDVKDLFSNSLVHFFNHVLGLPLDAWDINVLMCEPHELRTETSSVDHVHTGECISSVSVHHVNSSIHQGHSVSDLIHKRTVKEIRLLKGMHVELVARTIAHEAMHGWIALWRGQPCGVQTCCACPPKLSATVAEGLCEYAAYTFLEHRQQKLSSKSHRYKVIEYTKTRMLQNTSGVYAEGLSLALASMSQGSGMKLKRSKNAAFFKEVFSLSNFPQKSVLTPIKYNEKMSASLGTCGYCCREIEPSSTTMFEFVVVNGGTSCVCLSCYEDTQPKCQWCQDSLHLKPTVKGQDLHRDCFMNFENAHGDRCYVCEELLWEPSSDGGGFIRRSSYTSESGSNCRKSSSSSSRESSSSKRREVHERCGERCAHCDVIFQNEKFLTIEQDKLHEACFDAYQTSTGMVCGRCQLPLWCRSEGGGYARRTRMDDKGQEIHVECGDKCKQCRKLLNGKFIKLGKDQVHEECFDSYQLATGMCCGICERPLWRQGDGGRKTCMTTDKKTGAEIEIHIACSDCCVYCGVVLFETSPHANKNSGKRRGSVVTIDEKKNERVHDSCYLLWQHSKPSELCGECGSGLWVKDGSSFSRRSSVTSEHVHLCQNCVEQHYHTKR